MQPDCRPRFLYTGTVVLCLFLFAAPGAAFTAQSLDITVQNDGDATAVFSYALEGFIENAIPESMLKEELVKGLSTSDEPPEVISFDKSGATLLLKNFAATTDTSTGTEYLTVSMDFSKAEIALEDSAVSAVITADFTPQATTVTFPDGYSRTYSDSSTLPSIRHVVIDPSKKAATATATPMITATAKVTAKATDTVTAKATAKTTVKRTALPATTIPWESATVPSSGMPAGIVTVAVIALGGAGAYFYTRK